jgi:transcriptional regulator with XRE-family HTH domain
VILQLRWARAEQNLTQADVAKRAGVTQQAIAKLEHPDGNPTLATLEKVAAAFGLRLDVQLNAA